MDCLICSKNLNDEILITTCNHMFHKKCLGKCFLNSLVNNIRFCCPICYEKIKYDSKIGMSLINNKTIMERNALRIGKKYLIQNKIYPNLNEIGILDFVSKVSDDKYSNIYFCKFIMGDQNMKWEEFYLSNQWKFVLYE